jgi:hypothetical protein
MMANALNKELNMSRIIKVTITNNRLSYRTVEDSNLTGWSGYIECDAINIMIEHLMTVARRDGKATTERKLIDRIFQGENLGLYNIGEFSVNVMV